MQEEHDINHDLFLNESKAIHFLKSKTILGYIVFCEEEVHPDRAFTSAEGFSPVIESKPTMKCSGDVCLSHNIN